MTTNARKTDAQRLGNGKKAFNVKQVEKMVEDAGGSYTAGTGIVISNDEISVDAQTVAMKSELPDLNDYQEKLTAGDNITIIDALISAKAITEIPMNEWASLVEGTSSSYTIKENLIIMDMNYKSIEYVSKDVQYASNSDKVAFYGDMASVDYRGYGVAKPRLYEILTTEGNNYIAGPITFITGVKITNDMVNLCSDQFGGNVLYVKSSFKIFKVM